MKKNSRIINIELDLKDYIDIKSQYSKDELLDVICRMRQDSKIIRKAMKRKQAHLRG